MARQQAHQAPKIDPLTLRGLAPGGVEDLGPGVDLDGLRFSGVRVESGLAGATLLECEFNELSEEKLELRGARLLESRISGSVIPTFAAHASVWRDAQLVASRVGACDLAESELRRTVFEGSKLGWVNLRGATMHDVLFRDCAFDEIDLGGATLARVAFEGCITEKLTLTQTTADGLDLRGLEFRAIEGLEGLRGSVLTSGQVANLAEVLAAHHGVRIDG